MTIPTLPLAGTSGLDGDLATRRFPLAGMVIAERASALPGHDDSRVAPRGQLPRARDPPGTSFSLAPGPLAAGPGTRQVL